MTERLENSRKHPWLRRLGYVAAYGVAFSPMAGLVGITQATHEDRFGANNATYGFKLDPESYLDFGPLGVLTSPERLGPIALEATVHEIPSSSDDSTVAVGNVVNSYAFEIENFDDVHKPIIVRELLTDSIQKAMYAELGWLALVGVGSIAFLPSVKKRLKPIAIAGLSAGAVMGTVGFQAVTESPRPGTEISVDDYSDLKVTGLSGEFTLSTLLPTIQNFLDRKERQRKTFIDTVNEALDDKSDLMRQRQDGDRIIFAYSDLHCSFAMAEVLRHMQEIYAAGTVINAGDITTNGLEIEQKCIELIEAIDEPVVNPNSPDEEVDAEQGAVIGNHDSSTTRKQIDDSKVERLDGETREIGEFTVLGDDDPERTPAFASGEATRVSREGKTEEEVGIELAESSIRDNPDIVVVHQPEAADAFKAAGGRATALLIGHSHQAEKPEATSQVTTFQIGTSGGIGQQTLDSLNTPLSLPTKDATSFAIRITASGEMYYQMITISPDTDVSVSEWILIEKPLPIKSDDRAFMRHNRQVA